MIKRLNHVAIAVPDLEAAAALYRDALGCEVSAPEASPENGVTVVFVDLGNAVIELMAPLGEASPIARFLKRNPAGGIHHVCLEVDDVDTAGERLRSKGVRPVGDGAVARGIHGNPVLFLQPQDLCGTLLELEES